MESSLSEKLMKITTAIEKTTATHFAALETHMKRQQQQQQEALSAQTDCESKTLLALIRMAEISTCSFGRDAALTYQQASPVRFANMLEHIANSFNVSRRMDEKGLAMRRKTNALCALPVTAQLC